jgi:hypothetical protein
VIEGAVEQISSGDKKVEVLKKVDLSIVDGIIRTAKAYNITDILISFKAQHGASNLIFGNISENLLNKSKQAVIISKILQPLNTFKRIIVVLTPNAELENGFIRLISRLNNMLKQIGSESYIYGFQTTLDRFSYEIADKKKVFFKYKTIENFEDFDLITNPKEDDLFILVTARKQTVSYDFHVDEMAKKLNKNHEFTSFAVFYPEISKALQDGRISDMTTSSLEQNIEKVKQLTEKITGIFKKDEETEI